MARMLAEFEPPALISQTKLYATFKKGSQNMVKDHKYREKVTGGSCHIQLGSETN